LTINSIFGLLELIFNPSTYRQHPPEGHKIREALSEAVVCQGVVFDIRQSVLARVNGAVHIQQPHHLLMHKVKPR